MSAAAEVAGRVQLHRRRSANRLAARGDQRHAKRFVKDGTERWLIPALDGERTPFLLETSRPGVFAAGDVRAGSVKRVASAVGEGSMAVQFVHEHLKEL